jgi:predicted nucleotidyltransferase
MMEPSFEKLLGRLAEAGVAFVLVGGVAVTLHGYVRFTDDVDLLIERTPENIERLLASLAGYGEGFAAELDAADFDDAEGAIRIVEEVESAQLDLFTRMSGLTHEDLLRDADIFVLPNGLKIHYASMAALIELKERSGREKDRLDANALRQLKADPEAFS